MFQGCSTSFEPLNRGEFHRCLRSSKQQEGSDKLDIHVRMVNGNVFTSGSNEYGRLGIPTTKPYMQLSPVFKFNKFLSRLRVVEVCLGRGHGIGRMADGLVYAWGSNDSGQLGIGRHHPTRIDSHAPSLVPLPGAAVSVSAGYAHSICALLDGTCYAWGLNTHGQLGIGSSISVGYSPGPCAFRCSPSTFNCRITVVAACSLYSVASDGSYGVLYYSGKLNMPGLDQAREFVYFTTSENKILGKVLSIVARSSGILFKCVACITSVFPSQLVLPCISKSFLTVEGEFNSFDWWKCATIRIHNSSGRIHFVQAVAQVSSPKKGAYVIEFNVPSSLAPGEYTTGVVVVEGTQSWATITGRIHKDNSFVIVPKNALHIHPHNAVTCMNLQESHKLRIPMDSTLDQNTLVNILVQSKSVEASRTLPLNTTGYINNNALCLDSFDETTCAANSILSLTVRLNNASTSFPTNIVIYPFIIQDAFKIMEDALLKSIAFCVVGVGEVSPYAARIRVGSNCFIENIISSTRRRHYVIHLACSVPVNSCSEVVELSVDAGLTWTRI